MEGGSLHAVARALMMRECNKSLAGSEPMFAGWSPAAGLWRPESALGQLAADPRSLVSKARA
jgi:hypothetical protein